MYELPYIGAWYLVLGACLLAAALQPLPPSPVYRTTSSLRSPTGLHNVADYSRARAADKSVLGSLPRELRRTLGAGIWGWGALWTQTFNAVNGRDRRAPGAAEPDRATPVSALRDAIDKQSKHADVPGAAKALAPGDQS